MESIQPLTFMEDVFLKLVIAGVIAFVFFMLNNEYKRIGRADIVKKALPIQAGLILAVLIELFTGGLK